MARPGTPEPAESFADRMEGAITSIAKAAAAVGALLTLSGLAGVWVITGRVASDASLAAKAAASLEPFGKALTGGLVLLLAGTAALFWSAETMLVGHVILAAALWLAPLWAPALLGGTSNSGVGAGIATLQSAGTVYGLFVVGLVAVEFVLRVRQRLEHGAKADTLKYGKGIREESDRKNVLMGPCHQLPYCRKFVREKCPIYHAKTTCWRELTGCMCEESVIRGAMENRPIPKDLVAARAMIPRNNKLTEAQKRSRCKSCVIYNEHQRHKYRVTLPVVLLAIAAIYAVGRPTMVAGVSRALGQANQTVTSATLNGVGKVSTPSYFVEILVAALVVAFMSYAIRLVEYALFKLKI